MSEARRSARRRRRRRPAALALAGLLAACAGTPRAPWPARSGDGPRAAAATRADDRALLILLSDRRGYEPFTVDRLVSRGPELRAGLALALGRVEGPAAQISLERLLRDPEPTVRRAAAFALGRLGETAAGPSLRRAVADPDTETGRLAVEALARLGLPLADAVAACEALGDEETLTRLLPPLWRFPVEDLLPVARWGLARAPAGTRRWAAYALARNEVAEARDELRALLASPDPWLRGWGARALGAVGERGDLGRLRPLLDGREAGPAVQALRAARRLIEAGVEAPPDAWRARLAELLDDPRPGLRLTAIEASGAWLLDPVLGDRLAELVAAGERRGRELALLALARGGDPRAAELARRAAAAAEPALRAVAAEAAVAAGAADLLDRLRDDPDPSVRQAVLAASLEGEGPQAVARARQALADADPGVRTAAVAWLAAHPRAPVEELATALRGPGSRRLVELALYGARALAARGLAEPLERGAVVAALEALAEDRVLPVRSAAAEALERLGQPRPSLGPVETGLGVLAYREIALRTAVPLRAELETRHGTLVLELDCPTTPLTCHNFLQLANQGFYDGLAFHRVLPDFVVQGGDPRGDGWGGPGYTVRDEGHSRPFERGVLGMALAGPNTAGSQFFITLARQPHLDGDFTAFGSVVAGEELLDLIVQGDSILRLREAGRAERPAIE